MKQSTIEDIVLRWKVTEAFTMAVSSVEDRSLWITTCNGSWFKTSFSYYSSVDKTYMGMLQNVNYFTNNCSVEGLVLYIAFYEGQTGKQWKELYESDINTYEDKGVTESMYEDNRWWERHLECFK